jgi:hypothetical protein
MLNKKYIVVFIVIGLFISAVFYMRMDVHGVVLNGIAKKKEVKKENNIGETFIYNCFDIKTPYNIINTKFEESDSKCIFSAKMVAPLGYMILSLEPENNNNDMDNHTGIQLRRRENEIYIEEKINENIIKFSNKQDRNVIYFVYDKDKVLTVSFTDLIEVDKIKNDDVKVIIDSIL